MPSLSFHDQVRSVERDEGGFQVTFCRRAAIYHLSTDQQELANQLEGALAKSAELEIEFDTLSMKIFAVRRRG